MCRRKPASLSLIVRTLLSAYAQLASLLYPWRWCLACFALLPFLALLLVASVGTPRAINTVAALAGPLICVPWGLLCLCVWFEPTRGNLQTGWLITHLPGALRSVVRWYAAVFLVIWLLVGLFVWPALALIGVRF